VRGGEGRLTHQTCRTVCQNLSNLSLVLFPTKWQVARDNKLLTME